VSSVFLGGYVTYANEAKVKALGVPKADLDQHGAVSDVVARSMAEGAREAAGADYALSTTGIAGPSGGSDAKPVGTVFIGLARKGGRTEVERHFYPTDRERFKELVSQSALDFLRRNLA